MRKTQLFLTLIVAVLLAASFMAAPLQALAQDTAPAATPPANQDASQAVAQPLTIFTAYPAQAIGLDETVTLPLTLRAGTAQPVNLSVENAPEGWEMSFRGGQRTVTSVFADGENDASVDLRITPDANAKAGDYTLTVVAAGSGETARLPITLTVQQKAPPKLTLETDLPTVRGKPSSTFRYNVTLRNDGADDLNVDLSAETPPAFTLSFMLNSQEVTSVPVAAGESKRLSAEAKALNEIPADTYPITIHAQSGDIGASLDLAAEVVGQPALALTTPDGRLSGQAMAGKSSAFKLIVSNSGSAPARNVALSASAPTGWNVALEPDAISELAPQQQMEVTANVQPAEKSLNGDYVVSFSARGDDVSSQSVDMRITLTTSTLWGITGVGLIAVAVAVVGLAVGRFGRR